MRRVHLVVPFLVLIAALTAPAVGSAQEPGVVIDEGSPGAEYAIPLETEREAAAAPQQRSGESSQESAPDSERSPAFGDGIDSSGSSSSAQEADPTPPPAPPAAPADTATGGGSSATAPADDAQAAGSKARENRSRSDKRPPQKNDRTSETPAVSTAQASAASDTTTDDSSNAAIIVLAAAVVIIGAAAGLILRRRLSPNRT